MDLVVGAFIGLVRLVTRLLILEKLVGRIIAACLVRSAVSHEEADIVAQFDGARRQRTGAVQERRQSLQCAGVVAQRVVAEGLDDGRVAAQILSWDLVLELLLGQQLTDETAHEDLQAARRLIDGEADEGRVEQPAANLLHERRVLGVARQGEHLTAAHRVAHDEDRHLRGELVLDEGRDVRDDLRGRARQATLRLLGRRLAPAALVEAEHLDAGLGQVREEVIVAIDVLAKAVDKDELGLDGAGGLSRERRR